MGCLWFLLIMWAGKVSFLKKLQRLVDNFVWTGQSRVRLDIISLPPACIIKQYQALLGSILLWVSIIDKHPLRDILGNHILQVSQRRWGTSDLSWMVTKCGHLKMGGSTTWQALCQLGDSMEAALASTPCQH